MEVIFMPEKLIVNHNKVLKLSNVLSRKIKEGEYEDFEKIVAIMENYIKSKGYQALGPLIQYTSAAIGEDGQAKIQLKLLRQASNYINNVDSTYTMESVLRIKDCMYVRFVGEEQKLKFAYDKINLTAYEEGIELLGNSYTVFINQQDDILTADVFMEKKHE
jgi:effector-binding domain-containing protein